MPAALSCDPSGKSLPMLTQHNQEDHETENKDCMLKGTEVQSVWWREWRVVERVEGEFVVKSQTWG